MQKGHIKTRIALGYDKVAENYLKRYPKFDPQHKKLLDKVVSTLPRNSRVLDLGCGPGVPYTKYISEKFDTTAVDFSREQIKLAKRHSPKAKYILSDFKDLEFPKETFNLITAFYSLIHVPIKEQPMIVKKVFNFLREGGYFLATMGHKEWEGREKNWLGSGINMYWSHLGEKENIKMLKDVGFKIIKTEIEHDQDSVEKTHLVILARKKSYLPNFG